MYRLIHFVNVYHPLHISFINASNVQISIFFFSSCERKRKKIFLKRKEKDEEDDDDDMKYRVGRARRVTNLVPSSNQSMCTGMPDVGEKKNDCMTIRVA